MKYSSGDKEEEEERNRVIRQVLPKEPIVDSFLAPHLMEAMKAPLLQALRNEIEVYKSYPKQGQYNPDAFNPRNNTTCFMGQGFGMNGHGFEGWTDYDLDMYRRALGTIDHKEWGGCTLLEIWAADHFKDHKEMVNKTFRYCWGDEKELPELDFFINPFYRNAQSGKMEITEDQKEEQKAAEHLVKVSHYVEIKDRLKKTGMSNPLNLAADEKDDPPPQRRRRRDEEDEDEED